MTDDQNLEHLYLSSWEKILTKSAELVFGELFEELLHLDENGEADQLGKSLSDAYDEDGSLRETLKTDLVKYVVSISNVYDSGDDKINIFKQDFSDKTVTIIFDEYCRTIIEDILPIIRIRSDKKILRNHRILIEDWIQTSLDLLRQEMVSQGEEDSLTPSRRGAVASGDGGGISIGYTRTR